jgi:predicted dehydrogenase
MSGATRLAASSEKQLARPRVGFAGVGWIGRHRLQAMTAVDGCEVIGIVEPDEKMARAACELTSNSARICSYEELLNSGLDGVVIATPNALHAEQSIAALERGISVFCQKPLARNGSEARRVVDAARAADRLLCVDLSYRFVEGIRQIKELVQSGELGTIYAADLAFHNAYGPDKPWFYDASLSGGGCLIDLGIHLVDLTLWIVDFPKVNQVTGNLFAQGKRLRGRVRQIEDYATGNLELEPDIAVQLACSWKTHAGCDAVIDVFFHGTQGGARLRNVNGSFFDFVTERFQGTQRQILSFPPEEWGGRAAVDWLSRLSVSNRFDPSADQLVAVSETLDLIYSS